VDGVLRNRIAAAVAPTTNAACTTRLGAAINGAYSGNVFDLQIIPNAAVPVAAIPKLMDPKQSLPATRARWFGLGFAGVAAAGTLRDESGNNSNLVAGTQLYPDVEPPYLPTLG
jgi:hypothetical protein